MRNGERKSKQKCGAATFRPSIYASAPYEICSSRTPRRKKRLNELKARLTTHRHRLAGRPADEVPKPIIGERLGGEPQHEREHLSNARRAGVGLICAGLRKGARAGMGRNKVLSPAGDAGSIAVVRDYVARTLNFSVAAPLDRIVFDRGRYVFDKAGCPQLLLAGKRSHC